jgi:AraC family transcriptional regulator, L-rhamnose operon transcriptional activator RhaR
MGSASTIGSRHHAPGTGFPMVRFEVYNCCFSSELLRRELSWTREDPLLGFLLWAGPYSSAGRGVLTLSLPPAALGECLVHLDALATLRHRPLAGHRPDIVGRLPLLFGELGRAVTQTSGLLSGEAGRYIPPSSRRCACSKPS